MQLAQAKTASAGDEREVRSGGGMILHAAEFDQFPREFFEPEYWASRGRVHRLGAGRGATWRVNSAQGDWVLRHYRRGGAIARLSDDRYLWTGHARSRSIVEWRLLARMRRVSLPVPKPVGARVTRNGITYAADLITAYLPDTQSLGELLAAGSIDAKMLTSVGRCVRSFHDSGVWHADLNAHNVLLDGGGKVYLIDFDRARVRAGEGWKSANLRRLRRSLDKLSVQRGAAGFAEDGWRALTAAYFHAVQ